MAITKTTGLPLAEGLTTAIDLPHTISYAIGYRIQIDGFSELPEDKRPPRNLWDKPFRLSAFFDDVFDRGMDEKGKTYAEIDLEEVE